MNKTTRKWLLGGFLLVFCGLLAITVHRSITFELGNRPSYTISERDQQRPNGIMVFCYHRILDDNQVVKVDERLSSNSQFHDFNVNVSDFKKQMNYLAAHHIKVISTAQMVQMVDQRQAIRGHYVVLTFDDIDRTTVDNAAPIMLKHHYPFTILVITGNTGEYRDGTKLATWPQILALQKRAGDKRAYAQHALPHRQRYPRLQCAT